MGKKYTPSGYQILDISALVDSADYGNGEVIPRDFSEDITLLYYLFETKKIVNKPILLRLSKNRYVEEIAWCSLVATQVIIFVLPMFVGTAIDGVTQYRFDYNTSNNTVTFTKFND